MKTQLKKRVQKSMETEFFFQMSFSFFAAILVMNKRLLESDSILNQAGRHFFISKLRGDRYIIGSS